MSVPPEQFARIGSVVNLAQFANKLIIIVGAGTVGSQVARELAVSGVGQLRFIDGDRLESHNRARHILPEDYIGDNKAEAVALHLATEVPSLRPSAVPHYVDDTVDDALLDSWLQDGDIIVSATDNGDVQRRVARRALALDIPAVMPGLYGSDRGEVVVQLGSGNPCFQCWDGFRPTNQQPRHVDALNVGALGVIQLATELCLEILDPGSQRAYLLRPIPEGLPQLFIRNQHELSIQPIEWRQNCPSCVVGLSPLREATGEGGNGHPTTRLSPRSTPPESEAQSPPRAEKDAVALLGNFLIALLVLAGACYFIGVVLAGFEREHAGEHSFAPFFLTLVGIGWITAGVYAVCRASMDFFVEQPRAWWWQIIGDIFKLS